MSVSSYRAAPCEKTLFSWLAYWLKRVFVITIGTNYFLGVDGFDSEDGISTSNSEEAHLNQLMIDISREVIVVTDSSKFKKRGFALITEMDKIDIMVTDSGIPAGEKSKLESMGIKVLIA